MIRFLRIAPELPVQKLENSLRYYREQLGFAVAAEMASGDYAIVERDGVAIHIFVEDLEGLHKELMGRGANVVQSDAGNEIKFTEPLSD